MRIGWMFQVQYPFGEKINGLVCTILQPNLRPGTSHDSGLEKGQIGGYSNP